MYRKQMNVDDEALTSILLNLKSNQQTTIENSVNEEAGKHSDEQYKSSHCVDLDSYTAVVNDKYSVSSKRKVFDKSSNDEQTHQPIDTRSKRTKHIDSGNYSIQTAGSIQSNSGTKHITTAEIRKYFHLPIQNAAKKLDICATILKKICRAKNIQKWPYRQIKSLTCAIQSLEMASLNRSLGDEERKKMREQIDCLQDSIDCIVANPSILNTIGESENVSLPPNTLIEFVKSHTPTSPSNRNAIINGRKVANSQSVSVVSDAASTSSTSSHVTSAARESSHRGAEGTSITKNGGESRGNSDAGASVNGSDLKPSAKNQQMKASRSVLAPAATATATANFTQTSASHIRSPNIKFNPKPLCLGRSHVQELREPTTLASGKKILFAGQVTLAPLVRKPFLSHVNKKPLVPLLEPDVCNMNADALASFHVIPSSILSSSESLTRSSDLTCYGYSHSEGPDYILPPISSIKTSGTAPPYHAPRSMFSHAYGMEASVDAGSIGFDGLTPTYASLSGAFMSSAFATHGQPPHGFESYYGAPGIEYAHHAPMSHRLVPQPLSYPFQQPYHHPSQPEMRFQFDSGSRVETSCSLHAPSVYSGMPHGHSSSYAFDRRV